MDSILVDTNSNTFLITKSDSIIYENFPENLKTGTLHPSFSIAKSYVGTLVDTAIDKGIITSAEDFVIKYLPELEKNDSRFKNQL
ncbi:hypothetical protein [Olivibacter sitiensis]|uniref:hypothetical protein n=1 Tax=Olivibacter sitiensis TaxID=376470 RepID=UPI0004009FF7|nr:hypothetical protein [Olivibacter sitiensis]